MNLQLDQKMRLFLVKWLFTPIYGFTVDEWWQLLRRHQFAIDPPYVPRTGLMAVGGLLTSAFARHETRVYGPHYRDVVVTSPVFILGHWRSGTTFLHNLLSIDPQFAYPNLWQVLNPHTFLTTERYAGIVRHVSPDTRMMDNLDLGVETPFEDEFATCGTLCSPFLSWAFPRDAELYDRYLTFREASQAEIELWKAALMRFYQKLTWKYQRPLLLKSPPHTCRIRLLLDMFPDARFIHIHRHPYDVFRSTKKQVEISFLTTCLQNARPADLDGWIMRRYKLVYDAYFEERALLSPDRFHEVRFEDLERDPLDQVQMIYERLHLPGFDAVEAPLRRYIGSFATYRKNAHRELPQPLRKTLAQTWQRSFETWSYAA